jgi:hypothetical protein
LDTKFGLVCHKSIGGHKLACYKKDTKKGRRFNLKTAQKGRSQSQSINCRKTYIYTHMQLDIIAMSTRHLSLTRSEKPFISSAVNSTILGVGKMRLSQDLCHLSDKCAFGVKFVPFDWPLIRRTANRTCLQVGS